MILVFLSRIFNFRNFLLGTSLFLAACGSVTSKKNPYLITDTSAGLVTLGMNAKTLKSSLIGGFHLKDKERSFGAKSIALYDHEEESLEMFFSCANTVSSAKDLKLLLGRKDCTVSFIEVYSPKFSTQKGLRAGIVLSEAKEMHEVDEVTESSLINTQEYVKFKDLTPYARLSRCKTYNIPDQYCLLNAIIIH